MDLLKFVLDIAKLTTTVRVTADSLVSTHGCYLFNAFISSNGSGEADAAVYDGIDTSGKERLNLFCVDEGMDQLLFMPPMPFEQGLYVDVGSYVKEVVLMFISESSLSYLGNS